MTGLRLPKRWTASAAKPAAGIFAIAFASILIGGPTLDATFALTAAGTAAAALLLAPRLPQAWLLAIPVSCDLVIGLLREALGGSVSGLSPLAMLPVAWVGLTLGRRSVLAITACTSLLLGLPIALVGPPQYPSNGWRGVVIWTVVAFVVGLGANRITAAQHRLTETAESRARVLAELVATQSAIADSVFDLDAVMRTVVDHAMRLTEAEAAVIELPDGDDLVYRAAAGIAAPHIGYRVPAQGSISGLAIRMGQVLIAEDTETDPRVHLKICRDIGARSMVVIPLPRGSGAGGVLKVYSAVPAAFGQEQADSLSLLASMVGSALIRAELIAKVSAQAVTDELTGLPNRRAWYAQLGAAMERARRSREPLTVLLVDLDSFKDVNDRQGHAAGDRVLRQVAADWLPALRETDFLGRIGGDEFGVILEGAKAATGAEIVARLDEALLDGQTMTAGIAEWDRHEDASAFVARADADMYAQKPGQRAAAVG